MSGRVWCSESDIYLSIYLLIIDDNDKNYKKYIV